MSAERHSAGAPGGAEARAMTTQTSPTTGRPYPLTMVCTVFRVPRATVYAQTAVTVDDAPGKRGPHTTGSDADLVAAIRTVLAETPFHGEGHRKVRVRLRALGWRVGKNRVLRLMRAHGLLAPQRGGHPHGDPAHAGTITTERPTSCGGPTPRGSTPRGRAGAGSSARSTTRALTSSGGTSRRSATAGRRSSRFTRACGPPSARSARTSLADWRCGATGTAICRRCVSRGTRLARDHAQPVLRRRAAVQRGHRALHAHAQGTMSVAAPLRHPRPGPGDHQRLHRTVQPRVAHRTIGSSDTGGRSTGDARDGRLITYLAVQETGCATPSRSGKGRWSARRKVSVVLELLRGADLESLSRRHRVTAATLSAWREDFLASGEAGLKRREVHVDDEETRRLKSVVADLATEKELLKHKIRHLEASGPLGWWRSKR